MSARAENTAPKGSVGKKGAAGKTGSVGKTGAARKKALELTINGKRIAAREGETVLEVARREGIYIPALCHIEDTAAWGACRLCLVEVSGMQKLQAACTTWVADGMVVKTDTPRVRARRESYLKMYLSDHNAYCEAPCTHACPTHIDIPAYIAALAAGDFAGAADIVRAELPFPGILGRVCPRYCEPVCRRGDVDEPIAICALHRAAADHDRKGGDRLRAVRTSGKRVAVIGAGPAGLAAAWFLTQRGHQVTLYDGREKPGGLLRYGIPEFKLPSRVLDEELQPLWDAGVRFVGGSQVAGADRGGGAGVARGAASLLNAGFDAVVVGTGSRPAPGVRAAGGKKATGRAADSNAVLSGVDLLERVQSGEKVVLADKVIVAGDGVVALDAARTALRLGATEVTVVTAYQADTLPAGGRELTVATEEGVKFEYGVKIAKAESLAAAGTTVIVATEPSGGKRLEADAFTGRTAQEGVFAAGDAVAGAQSVIHAMAAGKRTALAVDGWLRGEDLAALEEEAVFVRGSAVLEATEESR